LLVRRRNQRFEQDLNYFASKGIVGKIESAKEVLFVMTSAAIDTERMNQIIDETRKAITFESWCLTQRMMWQSSSCQQIT
jgi:hypothetical protein